MAQSFKKNIRCRGVLTWSARLAVVGRDDFSKPFDDRVEGMQRNSAIAEEYLGNEVATMAIITAIWSRSDTGSAIHAFIKGILARTSRFETSGVIEWPDCRTS